MKEKTRLKGTRNKISHFGRKGGAGSSSRKKENDFFLQEKDADHGEKSGGSKGSNSSQRGGKRKNLFENRQAETQRGATIRTRERE